jgi:hypothetical protein
MNIEVDMKFVLRTMGFSCITINIVPENHKLTKRNKLENRKNVFVNLGVL